MSHACPTRHEAVHDAGHTAAALYASTRGAPLVEAWISERGLGLFAHEAAARSDAPERLAERLARHLLIPAADLEPPAAARGAQFQRLPSDAGWELALGLASHGNPSWLFPPGVASAVLGASAERGREALDGYVAGPLKLAILAPSGVMATRVRRRLFELLGGSNVTPCPPWPASEQPPIAGEYLVTSDEPSAHLVWPLAPGDNPEAARLVADLLNRRGGWLSRALAPTRVETGHARVLGLSDAGSAALVSPGALVISLRAPMSSLGAAIHQTRALVEKVRRALPSPADYTLAERERLGSLESAADPRDRLLALHSPRGPWPSLLQVRRFVEARLTPDSLILVRPKPPPE
jgi:hypothetical protein